MEFSADANGITVKKLFSKTEITYPEIASIIISECYTTITLKSGKIYKRNALKALTEEYPVIFDAIEKYNIEFKDVYEESFLEPGESYTIEDIRSICKKAEPKLLEYAAPIVAEKLGPDYSVRLTVKESLQCVNIHLVLLKNGSVVMVPDVAKNEVTPDMPESFDSVLIALLYEWDVSYLYGKYSLQFDAEYEPDCRSFKESIIDFCDYYIPETPPNTVK